MKGKFASSAEHQDTLLSVNDPQPVIIQRGTSPLLFTGPHNGFAVPEKLYIDGKPLGLDPACFDEASGRAIHEAADLNVTRNLWPALTKRFTNANFLSSPYSRLVVDLNRRPKATFKGFDRTQEHGHEIPANTGLTKREKRQRLYEIYHPYHNAKADLVEHIKRRHNGAVFLLDIHSFTPEMNGQPRFEQIGILDADNNPYAQLFAQHLQESDFYSAPGLPYDISPNGEHNARSAAEWVMDKSNLYYLGIEIRNDLLGSPDQVARVLDFIAGFAARIENHPAPETLVRGLSQSQLRPQPRVQSAAGAISLALGPATA